MDGRRGCLKGRGAIPGGPVIGTNPLVGDDRARAAAFGLDFNGLDAEGKALLLP